MPLRPATRPMARATAAIEPISGQGLGLAIARTIIEAHDGTLTAREPAATGARLVIELPAWEAPPEEAP